MCVFCRNLVVDDRVKTSPKRYFMSLSRKKKLSYCGTECLFFHTRLVGIAMVCALFANFSLCAVRCQLFSLYVENDS